MRALNFWVDIEDASGNKLGAGPLRPTRFPRTRKLSKSGEFSFDVSPSDPNLAILQEKRIAVCRYINMAGDVAEFGGGVIDKIAAQISEDGILSFHVSGNDILRELNYRSVGALLLATAGGVGVDDGPDQIIALAPPGWTLNDGTTDKDVYVGFDGESVLNALSRVGEHIGEHWRLGDGREVDWLGSASGFSASGVRAVQHVNDAVASETASGIVVISNLEEESDAYPILTRAIPRGSGNGKVIANLTHATDAAPAGFTLDAANNTLKNDAAETTYGRIERAVDFKELGPLSNTTADIQAASNMILQASVEHLRRHAIPEKFYRLDVVNVNEVLLPGMTLRVVYRKLIDGVVIYDLDDDFNIVAVDSELTATGASTTAVHISSTDRLAMSDEEYLASQIQEAKVMNTHQQLGPSVDTLTWQDEMDNANGATIPFWLGDDYTSINRAILRFRVAALRSTVKTVSGSSTTTASGGGSTSGSGGASTPTSSGSPHGHGLNIVNGSGGVAVTVDGAPSGQLKNTGAGSTVWTSNESPSHTHTVTIPNHTHSTPNHTHTLTPNISTVYGIFEESGASTLAIGDLVIKLNGGSDLSGDVDDISNGWYELDITDELVDSAFRPTQKNNEIAITTSVAKTARIEAQLKIMGAVQAVAYN
jgi:hypothetical protein